MANTLTGLIPTLYESLDVVARELIGFIPAVTKNVSAERAALNQTILVPITQANALQDNTSAVTAPNTGDQTVTTTPVSITKSKFAPVRWNGEDTRGMLTAGTYHAVLRDQFTQAFRTLANQIETDLFTAAYQGSSRASGTAGTTPFGTAGDLSDLANVRKILDNNGAPQSDLHCVVGSAAAATLRGKQSLLLKLNESGSSGLLRRGSITELPIEGFEMHNSAAVKQVTKGTGGSYVTSGDSPAGTTSIALVTGSGTVLAGDVITFASGDTTDNFVVNTGVAAAGTIVIGAPGTITDVPTADAMTIGASYTPNMVFHRSSLQLVARVPALPIDFDGKPNDMADDTIQVTDPVSGITFEIALYRQFLQQLFAVRLAWGVAAIKPNFIATMMG